MIGADLSAAETRPSNCPRGGTVVAAVTPLATRPPRTAAAPAGVLAKAPAGFRSKRLPTEVALLARGWIVCGCQLLCLCGERQLEPLIGK